MQITEVEALILRQPDAIDVAAADGSQDALLVKVHTDAGITGIGEVDSLPSVVKAVIEAPSSHKIANGLASLLVGEDPLQIGRLWQRMYEGSLYFGRRGVVLHAISGLEIALWDIAGKAARKPIHALLGGARRTRIKAYASTLMPESPAQVRQVVEAQRSAGFAAVKLGWGPLGDDADGDVKLVAAAREAGGQDFDLLIDVGKNWPSAREAIERTRRLERYRPFWIEEPFMPDDYAKYRKLSSSVDIPIAAGEEETTLSDFERLLEEGDVEVLQPDVTRAGGLAESLRVADLARRHGRRCVTHSWSTGIIKAASLHVLAAMEEAELFEYCVQETELNRQLVAERFPLHGGMVDIPSKPGLGVELDEEVVRRCTVGAS
ncbi:MAG: mandelate racemase/muconate lactonizing enzyme family protein [Candidatus Dormibacteraceae bacterium]